VTNNFIAQFSKNIKFSYTSFDGVILRGYILELFYEAGVASFLKSIGFVKRSNGVMRIFTDPPANRLDTLSLKLQTFYILPSLVKYHILSRHWQAETTINNPRSLGLKKPVLDHLNHKIPAPDLRKDSA